MTVEEMKSTDAQGLNYNPITPRFGAELDAGKALVTLTDDEVGALVQLAAERGVVVRDQDMTPQQHADFAHRLGRPLTTPMNKRALPEELLLIQANEKSKGAAGTGWHTDVSVRCSRPDCQCCAWRWYRMPAAIRCLLICAKSLHRYRQLCRNFYKPLPRVMSREDIIYT